MRLDHIAAAAAGPDQGIPTNAIVWIYLENGIRAVLAAVVIVRNVSADKRSKTEAQYDQNDYKTYCTNKPLVIVEPVENVLHRYSVARSGGEVMGL